MFRKVDGDGSGQIEIGEMDKMFRDYGILIPRDELKTLF